MSDLNTNIRTGAAYVRVSTDKQEELSPDAQKRLLLEYAKKNNIVVPEEFILLKMEYLENMQISVLNFKK